MIMKNIKLLLLLLLFSNLYLNGQLNLLDSLKNNILVHKNDDKKLLAVCNLCDKWESFNADTLIKYIQIEKKLAAQQKNEKVNLLVQFNTAAYLLQINKPDSVLKLINSFSNNFEKYYPVGIENINLYRLKSNALLRKVNYNELLKYSLYYLKRSESKKDTLGQIFASMNIGNVNNRLEKKEEALNWYRKGLLLMKNNFLKQKAANIYNNIAIAQYKLGRKDSTLFYLALGIENLKNGENLTQYANSLLLYGGMLAEFGQKKEAEINYKKGLATREKIGDIYYIIADMTQISNFYLSTSQYQKSITTCNKAIELAKKNNYINVEDIYQNLAKSYSLIGNYKNANFVLEKYNALKDTVYQKNSEKAMAEMQSKYEYDKQQIKIKTLENDKLQKQNEKNSLIRNILLASLLAGLGLVFYVYKNNLNLQSKNLQLVNKNNEIEEALLKGTLQERKRVASELHDNLSAKISGIKWRLEAIKPSFETEKQNQIYQSSVNALAEVYTDVRLISHNLLPAELETKGIKFALNNLVIELNGLDKTKFSLNIQENLPKIKSKIEYELFSIILELSNNILKHSHAKEAEINLQEIDNQWVLKVTDNGIGFSETENKKGMGFANLKSRVESINGKMNIESEKGVKVVIEVPV